MDGAVHAERHTILYLIVLYQVLPLVEIISQTLGVAILLLTPTPDLLTPVQAASTELHTATRSKIR